MKRYIKKSIILTIIITLFQLINMGQINAVPVNYGPYYTNSTTRMWDSEDRAYYDGCIARASLRVSDISYNRETGELTIVSPSGECYAAVTTSYVFASAYIYVIDNTGTETTFSGASASAGTRWSSGGSWSTPNTWIINIGANKTWIQFYLSCYTSSATSGTFEFTGSAEIIV